jgi:hypothetical protein
MPETPALTVPAPAPLPSPAPADPAAAHLDALIGEAEDIVRTIVVPTSCTCHSGSDCIAFLDEAVKLMKAASRLGDTLARLRGGETRRRLVVEHLLREGEQTCEK